MMKIPAKRISSVVRIKAPSLAALEIGAP